ncbi:hypothetical protein L6452_33520 [Arctium lappa]|uniref:Uncharacterized protein n=1 Tax=Arctium lappa TaxID=4217 RepID=A0ACB8YEY6_ARCLA|nr:hypothetical protein L6452_33520 [Arctium lappa]
MALSRFILNNLTHTQRSPLKTHPWLWSSQLLHQCFSSSATTADHEKLHTKLFSPTNFLKPGVRNTVAEAAATVNRLLANLSPRHLMRRLKEKDESYNIKYEMPGFSKDDVKITVEDGILFIRGERKEEEKDSGDDEYWSTAASYGYYDTSLRLPEDAKVEEITAEMKDGVLHVVIPKDETKKKQIKEIQVG